MLTDNQIIVKNFDIRNFYVDDMVIDDFKDANDCIAVQYISYEKLQNFKYNRVYKNLDKIVPTTYLNDYKPFVVQEEWNKNAKLIKLKHYWNLDKDKYIVLANDNVIIREHPILSTI